MIVYLIVFFTSSIVSVSQSTPFLWQQVSTAREACLTLETKEDAHGVFKAQVDQKTGRVIWMQPVKCAVSVEAR